jgi:hypothetical protein
MRFDMRCTAIHTLGDPKDGRFLVCMEADIPQVSADRDRPEPASHSVFRFETSNPGVIDSLQVGARFRIDVNDADAT